MEKYVEMFSEDLQIDHNLVFILNYSEAIIRNGAISDSGILELFKSGLKIIKEIHIPIIEQEIGKELKWNTIYWDEKTTLGTDLVEVKERLFLLGFFSRMLASRYGGSLRTLKYSVRYIEEYFDRLIDYSRQSGKREIREYDSSVFSEEDRCRIIGIVQILRKHSIIGFRKFYYYELCGGIDHIFGKGISTDWEFRGVEEYREYEGYLTEILKTIKVNESTDRRIVRYLAMVKELIFIIRREIEFLT